MEIYPDQQNEVKWSSWLPALGYALGASTGPVLEIGVGHFSTPFLHEYCKASRRELWSVEADDAWRLEFEARFASDYHHFRNPPEPFEYPKHWGVVFIDNSPGGEGRAIHFRLAIPISDFIVVHDYWKDNEEAIGPLLDGVPHKIFLQYEPPTLLASKKFKNLL